MSALHLLLAHGDSSWAFDLNPIGVGTGAVVRFGQAVFAGVPYLLGGAAFSGLLRGVVGGAAVRRRLGTPSVGGAARASILGFVMPLGALGALPAARGLWALGASRGAVLAFLLSAAVLDPLSLVFGLSLLGPGAVVGCATLLLVWAAGCGVLVDRSTSSSSAAATVEAVPGTALGRLVRVLASMAAELAGPSLRDLLLAAAGAGLLGAFAPHGWLEEAVAPSRPLTGGLVAAAVGAVASETPVEAMRQAGVLLRDGFSHQVAFVLLAFGAGLNLPVLVWLRRGLGLRPGLPAVVLALGLGAWLLLGWGFDRFERPTTGASHTHALDDVGRPNLGGRDVRQAGADAWTLLVRSAGGLPALTLAILLAVAGGLARQPRIRAWLTRWEQTLDTPRPTAQSRAWERPLSSRGIVAFGLAASTPAIAALILTHYPAPAVLFDEMTAAHTEVQYAVRHGDVDEALAWLERWDDLIRKLGPAALLRHGSLDVAARRRLDELIDDVAALRAFLEEGRIEEARTLLEPVSKAQTECRRAFEASG